MTLVRRMQRHDLVWPRRGAPVEPAACCSAHGAALAGWIARGLPLVCARQADATLPVSAAPDSAPRVRLGLTLPGTGERRRVSASAAAHDIARSAPPPLLADLLADLLAELPPAQRAPLDRLARRATTLGAPPRVYGTLLWQHLSGEACLRPGSDIDLLFDCTPQTDVRALLALLQCGADAPRLDGEVRFADGRAVAWRELAQALSGRGPTRVLAKSDHALELVEAGQLLTHTAGATA
jgi:phosphoribosyl-dephospho-CoA transferase